MTKGKTSETDKSITYGPSIFRCYGSITWLRHDGILIDPWQIPAGGHAVDSMTVGSRLTAQNWILFSTPGVATSDQ